MIELIKSRRSIREFTQEEVSEDLIEKIIEAGKWAPSGLNNQPWRFLIIRKQDKIEEISKYTKYKKTVNSAKVLIIVFLDKGSSYNYIKDVQAIGACIQNMLLFIHELGLGACWIGEILNQSEELNRYLRVKDNLELMAVLVIGHPVKKERKSSRRDIQDLVIGWG
ncbi:MAG: nitroreductase [bacterium]|nr:nitroreductase [bacterium]